MEILKTIISNNMTTKKDFTKLLDKAIKPSESKSQTKKEGFSSKSSGKKTRQRKTASVSRKRNDKSR